MQRIQRKYNQYRENITTITKKTITMLCLIGTIIIAWISRIIIIYLNIIKDNWRIIVVVENASTIVITIDDSCGCNNN